MEKRTYYKSELSLYNKITITTVLITYYYYLL